MTEPNPSTALARVVIDELVRGGVSLIVISPGSRSAALAIAAVENVETETVVFLDERSAGFYALGRAKATGAPVAVLATSGTAPTNWFPAVVEADSSSTPLILVSADRPAELRGVGANQTIDQVELFGNKVRMFEEIAAPDGSDRNQEWRTTVHRAVTAARGLGLPAPVGRPGPAHLNIAFREPTVPVSDDGRSVADPYPHSIERIELNGATESGGLGDAIDDPIPPSTRGLVIAGDGDYDRPGLLDVAGRLGWPVLATAVSGLRGSGVITSYHHIIPLLSESLTPEMVVAVGAIGPSQSLDKLVARGEVRVRIDAWGRSIDPNRDATHVFAADPVSVLNRIEPKPDPVWSTTWGESDEAVRRGLNRYLDTVPEISGAAVARQLDRVDRGAMVVASSLPIREIDAHLTTAGPVIANRGASGIDGFISTALGVASALPRTLAFTGDLSLFHDSNAWLNDGDVDLTLVVVDNGGGGLFDLLPQRNHAPEFERLFITPHGRRIGDLATLHGLTHVRVSDPDRLRLTVEAALEAGGRHLLEVPVDRDTDFQVHRGLMAAAESALGKP